MSETILGTFDETYHHIDAPTYEDKEASERCHCRTLDYTPITIGDYTHPGFYYLQDNEWIATRKLDGTNIRIRWDGEQAIVAGKTNKANLSSLGDAFVNYIKEHFYEERFEEVFGREKEVVIFGEWVGPKVQSNELGLTEPELVVFDVKIGGVWLEKDNVEDVALRFDCNTPYDFMEDGEIVDTLWNLMYVVSTGRYKDWEGIVAEPAGQFRDKQGNRIICKIKTKDYYREERRKNEI